MSPLLELRAVSKHYPQGSGALEVLREVDLSIAAGEFVLIAGPSGSGKSTLLSLIGLLERPSAGSYHLSGHDVTSLSDDALAALRNRHMGFIFQQYHLIPRLNALRNVELPLVYAGVEAGRRHQMAATALAAVGLGDRLEHLPAALSGGQQQRVAMARALINNPDIILADEPTAALDHVNARRTVELLSGLHAGGKTIVMVSHDMSLSRHASRLIELADGAIAGDRTP